MRFFENKINEITDRVRYNCSEVQELYLKGSNALENMEVDMWSDIDLVLKLGDKYDIHEFDIYFLLEGLGKVIASEVYSEDTIICHRVFLDSEEFGYSLDISVIKRDGIYDDILDENSKLLLSRDEKVCTKNKSIIDKSKHKEIGDQLISDESINSFWFKLIVSVKKIMRSDNLIGFHLLLDVVRDTVVLQMINRDIKNGTNIHRYGKDEEIDIMKYITMDSTGINKKDMLDTLDQCARYYDDEVSKLSSSYEKKYTAIKKYIDTSKNEI